MASTKQKTTAWFVEESRRKHGDRFDYSKSVYVNMSTKILIVCPDHGKFEQGPREHHRSRHGCPECSKGKVHERIEKAVAARAGKPAWNKGVARTQEQNDHQSVLMKSKAADPNYVHSRTGAILSDETKEKIAASLTGFKHTDETRMKISENNAKSNSTPITVNGVDYPSITEAAHFYQLEPANVVARLNAYGWTVPEAFGLTPRVYDYSDRDGFIYRITNTIDGKVYIGTTIHSTRRWKEHLYAARKGKNTRLCRAIRLHGEDAFRFEVLETIPDHNMRAIRENELINEHDSLNEDHGYNEMDGGSLGAVGVGKSVQLNGVTYPSIGAACHAHSIPYVTYWRRMSRGWNQIEALTTPPNQVHATKKSE